MTVMQEAGSPAGGAMRADAPKSDQGGVERLSIWRLAAYGQLVVPLSVVGLPLAVYLPAFYGGTLGLNLALVGVVMNSNVARTLVIVSRPR